MRHGITKSLVCISLVMLLTAANLGLAAGEKDKTTPPAAQAQKAKVDDVTPVAKAGKESPAASQTAPEKANPASSTTPALSQPKTKKTAAVSSTQTKSALDILENTRISVDYENTGFRDVINDLRDQLNINIIVYWPELKWAGFSPDDNISIRLNKVPAEQVVAAVVAYLASGSSYQLGYQVDRNVLEIRLLENISQRQEVKVYYVADLLSRPSRYDDSYFNNNGENGGGRQGFGSGRSNSRSNRSGSGNTSSRSWESSDLRRTVNQSIRR